MAGIGARVRMDSGTLRRDAGGRVDRMVAPLQRPCFRVDRLTINGEFVHEDDAPWHITVVTAGRGTVHSGAADARIVQGDHFFVPHAAGALRYTAVEPLTIYAISADSR